MSDFGLSRFKDETYSYMNPTSPFDVTITAPEVLEENRISERADVFSFALLLLELHTATKPYEGKNPHWVAWKVMHTALRPSIPDTLDRGCAALVEHCWRTEPQQRPSFSTVCEKLEGMLESLEVVLPVEEDSEMSAASATNAFT